MKYELYETNYSAVIIIFHLEQIATEIISPQCIYL